MFEGENNCLFQYALLFSTLGFDSICAELDTVCQFAAVVEEVDIFTRSVVAHQITALQYFTE